MLALKNNFHPQKKISANITKIISFQNNNLLNTFSLWKIHFLLWAGTNYDAYVGIPWPVDYSYQ